jgi:uncharacterized protein YkwD
VTRYVRRAAITAAILAVPLTTAAMFAVGSGATASAAPLATPVAQSVSTVDTADYQDVDDLVYAPAVVSADGTVKFEDVKKKKKKKKKTVTKKATAPKATAPKATAPSTSTTTNLAAYETEVIRLTNVERGKVGCGALRADSRLTDAARLHSQDMVTKNYFSHTGSNGSTFVTREQAAGYPSPSAENIAWGQRTPADVMNAWMNSAGHKANILSCGSHAVGVGVVLNAQGAPYWTQDFGR